MDADLPQLTDEEVAAVLARHGGWCHLLELSRYGYIDTERAVTAVERDRSVSRAVCRWWSGIWRGGSSRPAARKQGDSSVCGGGVAGDRSSPASEPPGGAGGDGGR